jgi:heme a synthase
VGLVLTQALVGGLRVLFDNLHIDLVNTSLGRLFAMLHAFLAQAFVCTLISIAIASSRPWIEGASRWTGPTQARLRVLGTWCVALLFIQLSIAAVVRHSFAGLAIPTFPFSTSEGGWLPAVWDFRVGIHFTHRVMAGVIAIALVAFVVQLWREPTVPGPLRGLGLALLGLISLQVTLGAQIIWTGRSVTMTTGHVVIGALTLALTFLLTFFMYHGSLGSKAA